jgi:hypothetical protein
MLPVDTVGFGGHAEGSLVHHCSGQYTGVLRMLRLTELLFLGSEPSARVNLLRQNDQGEYGKQESEATFDKEQDSPGLECIAVDE